MLLFLLSHLPPEISELRMVQEHMGKTKVDFRRKPLDLSKPGQRIKDFLRVHDSGSRLRMVDEPASTHDALISLLRIRQSATDMPPDCRGNHDSKRFFSQSSVFSGSPFAIMRNSRIKYP